MIEIEDSLPDGGSQGDADTPCGSEGDCLQRASISEGVDTGIPKHVAVIMDGNGRWAVSQGMSRDDGHRRGVVRVMEIIDESVMLGVKVLTLYAFSTENWLRSSSEVCDLMDLIRESLAYVNSFVDYPGVRVRFLGARKELDKRIILLMDAIEDSTRGGDKLIVQFALNYGGRREIVDAVKLIVNDLLEQRECSLEDMIDKIDENLITENLYYADVPDPDIIIRTAGEYRISNFLLWQSAYSELFFVQERWPEFSREHFRDVVESYINERSRKFGRS